MSDEQEVWIETPSVGKLWREGQFVYYNLPQDNHFTMVEAKEILVAKNKFAAGKELFWCVDVRKQKKSTWFPLLR